MFHFTQRLHSLHYFTDLACLQKMSPNGCYCGPRRPCSVHNLLRPTLPDHVTSTRLYTQVQTTRRKLKSFFGLSRGHGKKILTVRGTAAGYIITGTTEAASDKHKTKTTCLQLGPSGEPLGVNSSSTQDVQTCAAHVRNTHRTVNPSCGSKEPSPDAPRLT